MWCRLLYYLYSYVMKFFPSDPGGWGWGEEGRRGGSDRRPGSVGGRSSSSSGSRRSSFFWLPPFFLPPFFIHSFFQRSGSEDVQQTGILPAGAEQDGVGGSGAVPEPDAGGLRSLWLCVVSACECVCVRVRRGEVAQITWSEDEKKVRLKATLCGFCYLHFRRNEAFRFARG